MDPITLSILAVLLLGGGVGGYYWYEKYGPGAAPSSNAPVQIQLDASLPTGDQQAVIAAIMTQTSPAALTTMAAKYASFPWTVYELNYRAWQLGGSQGAPPAQPVAPSAPVAPQQPLVPQPPSGGGGFTIPPPGVLPTPASPPAPTPPSGGPSPGPFDLSAALTAGAWQSNPVFIAAYQGALTYLAWKYAQPTWAPPAVNGVFDASTKAAVMAFQTAKGLSPIDGEVGKDTATAMATALTAPATQTSGQGSYATFPAGGTGPGDSRYGAAGSPHIRDQVHGLGEDVQGLGEGVQGLGEGVQGLGEDVQGVRAKKRTATSGLGEGVQGLGEGVQGLGEGVQGLGEDEVQGVLKKKAAQVVGAAMVAPPVARSRPRGGWFIRMRDTDSIWPRKIAEIGSGVPRGTPGSLQHLADINPHLAIGGALRQLRPGDEVNIPGSWASALKQKGLNVLPDESEGVL
jgi:peptidoglycan hydrolase-like protein with peptidoglycan-binding domain